MDFETVNGEVENLSFRLRDADAATIAAHQARLRVKAEQIPDDLWRRRAYQRIEKLAELARPPLGVSPQYSEAVTLVARAKSFDGPVAARIAELERVKGLVADLARQAPRDEYMVIMRMNSSIIRLIERLESADG